MRVIGTAGHVDHGKSTLVKRLTGIDPDRLAEEKSRKLTIDLGFAWFDLPDGETVGIVDVPGHRDFIENMLAGVGGLDAALLVIAADEGVMPQTREHLAILDLLEVQNGLIVLTKIDMIDDPEWLDLVELDIRDQIAGTTLAEAELLRVSAHSGAGIDDLLDHLHHLLTALPPRADYHQPRLPVDRVFTVDGFGTVVTGTLTGGTLAVGDKVELQPRAVQARIRGLQSYQRQLEMAYPGSRVAVNLSGIDADDVQRGDVLAYPDQVQGTQLVDVQFRYLDDIDRPLTHNSEVKFFSGSSETIARVRLLDAERLAPGEQGWLQLRLRDAIPLTLRDRYILRYPSPAETIGGGVVVNPHPARRWKRFRPDLIAELETRLRGTPAERVVQAADSDIPQKRIHLQQVTGYHDEALDRALETAQADGQLLQLSDGRYWSRLRWQETQQRIKQEIISYHERFPLRLGIQREELRVRLSLKQALLAMLLAGQDQIQVRGALLKHHDHTIAFSEAQQARIAKLWQAFGATPYSPPSFAEASDIVGKDVLYALIDLGDMVQVTADILFARQAYHAMTMQVLALIDEHGSVDAKQVRDHFGTTRKYAIALLEHLDHIKVTQREGDVRIRGTRQPEA